MHFNTIFSITNKSYSDVNMSEEFIIMWTIKTKLQQYSYPASVSDTLVNKKTQRLIRSDKKIRFYDTSLINEAAVT